MLRGALVLLPALLLTVGCTPRFMGGDVARNQTAGPAAGGQDRVIARPENTARFADADMAAVSRNLAGLGARLFEQLTPQQARRQATPADAVKVVLKAQGRSTAPEGVAATHDIALPLPSGPVAGAMVLSAHYRQAPEHKFPKAHDDAWDTYTWLLANAATIGGDPNRIAVAGESAGGNLAANVPQRRRDARDPAQCGGSANPEQNVHGCDP